MEALEVRRQERQEHANVMCCKWTEAACSAICNECESKSNGQDDGSVQSYQIRWVTEIFSAIHGSFKYLGLPW